VFPRSSTWWRTHVVDDFRSSLRQQSGHALRPIAPGHHEVADIAAAARTSTGSLVSGQRSAVATWAPTKVEIGAPLARGAW
jgi:hypothetical protein